MQTHVKVVAGLFFVFGALKLCLALFVPLLLKLIVSFIDSSGDPDAANEAAILATVGVFVTVYLLVFAIPALLAGWGLMTNRGWARILAIVLAAFTLIEIPIGTLFGIYTMWVLFNKDTEALFAAPAASPTGS